MNIQHNPLLTDPKKAEEHYSNKDGVEVKYLCTTEILVSDVPVDVFYRETPHPEFGNRYIGLYYDRFVNDIMVCNADKVEELEFGMIQDHKGVYHYSQTHHDYVNVDSKMIDGGRQYIRHSGDVVIMKIIDGQFNLK